MFQTLDIRKYKKISIIKTNDIVDRSIIRTKNIGPKFYTHYFDKSLKFLIIRNNNIKLAEKDVYVMIQYIGIEERFFPSSNNWFDTDGSTVTVPVYEYIGNASKKTVDTFLKVYPELFI